MSRGSRERRLDAAVRRLRNEDDDDADRVFAAVVERLGVAEAPARIGRFQIVRRLGVGAMGVVFLARDPQLDRPVAIKLLRSSRRGHRGRTRLMREAQALARLRHPNVIGVHELGAHEDQLFVAMEYVDAGSLGAWLDAQERDVSQILDKFSQAARGLAAAHDAGIVHRDFKPENVLVGADGRAQVADFGLARDRTPESGEETPPEDGIQTRGEGLTRTGAVVGTPAYMAPELLGGAPATPASDQFSFCVALYEALFGQRPFQGGTVAELRATIRSGELPETGSVRVPRFVRAALRRGLDAEPRRRWPNMHALARELGRGPARRRRLLGLGTAAAAATAIGLAAFLAAAERSPCAGAGDGVTATWNAEGRDAIQAALIDSGSPDAQAVASTVERTLDAYAASWSAGAAEACEAARVRHEQSSAVFDRRMQCLERRRLELAALVQALSEPDPRTPRMAIGAAAELTPVEACADVAALSSVAPLPDDPALRERVEVGRKILAEVRALYNLGRVEAGDALLRGVPEDATESFAPLAAEVANKRGVGAMVGGDRKAALGFFREAFAEAQRGGESRIAAEVAVTAIHVAAVLRDFEDARRWAWLAAPLLDRVEAEPALRASYTRNLATIDLIEGNYDKAAAAYAEAEVAYAAAFAPDDARVAETKRARAGALRKLGRRDEALALLREADAILRKNFGDDSPNLAHVTNSLGIMLMQTDRLDEAQSHFERAVRLYDLGRSTPNPTGGNALFNLSEVHYLRGEYAEAIAAVDEAIARWKPALGEDHPYVGNGLHQRGLCELELGRPTDAEASLGRALKILEAAPDPIPDGLEEALARARAGR